MPLLSDSYLSPLVSMRKFGDESALNQQQGRIALQCLLRPLIQTWLMTQENLQGSITWCAVLGKTQSFSCCTIQCFGSNNPQILTLSQITQKLINSSSYLHSIISIQLTLYFWNFSHIHTFLNGHHSNFIYYFKVTAALYKLYTGYYKAAKSVLICISCKICLNITAQVNLPYITGLSLLSKVLIPYSCLPLSCSFPVCQNHATFILDYINKQFSVLFLLGINTIGSLLAIMYIHIYTYVYRRCNEPDF